MPLKANVLKLIWREGVAKPPLLFFVLNKTIHISNTYSFVLKSRTNKSGTLTIPDAFHKKKTWLNVHSRVYFLPKSPTLGCKTWGLGGNISVASVLEANSFF